MHKPGVERALGVVVEGLAGTVALSLYDQYRMLHEDGAIRLSLFVQCLLQGVDT